MICTSAFPEYTSKPLQSTYARLAVLTRKPIPDVVVTDNDLIPLEHFRFPSPHVDAQECEMSMNAPEAVHPSNGRSLHPYRSRSRIFHVNLLPDIKLQQKKDSLRACETANTNASVFYTSSSSPPFNCYQLPMLYKGVQWRKTVRS